MPAIVQFYLSAIVLMLPLLFCVGIGVYWASATCRSAAPSSPRWSRR